jgi:hypothetical protein
MQIHVQLHAGWSVNNVVPILFPDRPIIDAFLSDETDEPGPVLLINGKILRPCDFAPEELTSRYNVVMGDVMIANYDRTDAQAILLVERWYRSADVPASKYSMLK